MPAVRLAPAERLNLLIEMNHPGVWVLGACDYGLEDP
jgi:hypothetical protein